MRKIKATAILGTMLLASIVPVTLQAAKTSKTRKSATHTGHRAVRVAPASSPASGSKAKSKSTKSGSKRSRSKKHDTSWRRGQKGPTPDRVVEIQEALARQGAYTGQPNGKWDAQTIEAMRRFQSSRSLNPTGKLDAPTLQKLGLGSDIAGIAPPQGTLPDGPLGLRRVR